MATWHPPWRNNDVISLHEADGPKNLRGGFGWSGCYLELLQRKRHGKTRSFFRVGIKAHMTFEIFLGQ